MPYAMRKFLFVLCAATFTFAVNAQQGKINNEVVKQRTEDQNSNGKTTGLTAIPGGAPDAGTFTDTRDGQTYKWVRIGDQVWMAENLNFASTGSWCYDNNATNCDHYGRLYTWDAVMNGASASNANPSGVQGICPPGWHVPGDVEWTQLVDYLVSQGYPNTDVVNGAGNALKSCRQIGSQEGGTCNTSAHPRWESHSTHYGTDKFGFSALPGGHRGTNEGFLALGITGYWWSASEALSMYNWSRLMGHNFLDVYRLKINKAYGLSVRCVRNH